VYTAQKENPVKGDWVLEIKENMEFINIRITDEAIKVMTKKEYQTIIKSKIEAAALNDYKQSQQNHSKINQIEYYALQMQDYIKCNKFNDREVGIIFNLRAKTMWGFKACFKSMWNDDIKCKLGCANENDTIEHIYNCAKIEVKGKCASSATYIDLFRDTECQQKALSEFTRLNSIRDTLLDQESGIPGPVPGHMHAAGRRGGGPAGSAGRRIRIRIRIYISKLQILLWYSY
jgi:hypothetical protein